MLALPQAMTNGKELLLSAAKGRSLGAIYRFDLLDQIAIYAV